VTVGDAIRVLLPTDALWQGVAYGLAPPLSTVDLERLADSPFFTDTPPSVAIVAWSAIWVVVVLVLGINQLRRREL